MNRRQLAVFFLMYACMSVMGYGLLPLLPVYATHLGMSPAVVGYYLSFAYLALASGALSAGWVFERVGRPRALLIGVGALSIPCILLMGWQGARLLCRHGRVRLRVSG